MNAQSPPTPESTVVDEARKLRSAGPGTITVLPTTTPAFNVALNTARAALDEAAKKRVEDALSEIEKILAGIEGASSTAIPKPIHTESGLKSIIRLILSPSTLLTGGESTAQATHNRMVAESGVDGVAKPAPRRLVKAAEARLVAVAAGASIDNETTHQLSLPWQSATVRH